MPVSVCCFPSTQNLSRHFFLDFHFIFPLLIYAPNMASELDPADFVDSDFQTSRKEHYTTDTAELSAAPSFNRPLSRGDVDAKVGETQAKLADLKRAQEELERERASLEELRRRQIECQTGREEMLQSLTRGVGLLEEAEFSARQQAEQMARTISSFRDSLHKVQAIHEPGWSKEDYNLELTRALTTIENARMEWNAARLKFELLSGKVSPETASPKTPLELLPTKNFAELCRLGLALTWPIAVVGLAIFLLLILRR